MRSSVREYIASEAMFYLGIPTTRALSLVGTGDSVMRDMFYKCAPFSKSERSQVCSTAARVPLCQQYGRPHTAGAALAQALTACRVVQHSASSCTLTQLQLPLMLRGEGVCIVCI